LAACRHIRARARPGRGVEGDVAVAAFGDGAVGHIEAAALRRAVEAEVGAAEVRTAAQHADAAAVGRRRVGGDHAGAEEYEAPRALDGRTLLAAGALDLHPVEGERTLVEDGAVARRQQGQVAQFGGDGRGHGKVADAVARARAAVAAIQDDGAPRAAVDDRVGGQCDALR
jgi:phage baseplate assembly protein gpV